MVNFSKIKQFDSFNLYMIESTNYFQTPRLSWTKTNVRKYYVSSTICRNRILYRVCYVHKFHTICNYNFLEIRRSLHVTLEDKTNHVSCLIPEEVFELKLTWVVPKKWYIIIESGCVNTMKILVTQARTLQINRYVFLIFTFANCLDID